MKKLVLFDIDGTLVRDNKSPVMLGRFPYALNAVFGLDLDVATIDWIYTGILDRAILWDLAKGKGVTRKEFEDKFPEVIVKFQEYFDSLKTQEQFYFPIVDAKNLAEVLMSKGVHVGVLTGNLVPAAEWKLEQAGMGSHFSFGLYGHEADDRSALATLVFSRAEKYFGTKFAPQEIVIIGDTVHDIACGKAIGAVTIAVTTGWNANRELLVAQKPDMLVDSLMDKPVRDFFGV
jgi:phosphoglycolate phosphatase-like HAD superfamily hydrolase